MNVRPFLAADQPIFFRLAQEFYDSGSALRDYDEKLTKMTFDRVLAHHENLEGYFITRNDSHEVVGYALITSYWCHEEGGTVLILDELYIAENFRHQGYASCFLEWLIEEYKEKAVALTLEVLTSNLTAQSLYQKEGFTPDGFMTMTKKIIF
ncbi:MAG: GNAT family N-acetyltransferase [Bacilli bacterium]|jgi:ribosomal protein S18 acetylase RimI-like enzyme